jgi:D-amino-acid dehydrogenase
VEARRRDLDRNAGSLHRADGRWRIDTAEGPLDAREVVLALGPFAPEILSPLGIRLPLGIKRGYHLHFRAGSNAALTRPIVDVENDYCLAPMEQGIRLTTGAEFAARAALPTPVQLGRLLPDARALFRLADPVEATPWMGADRALRIPDP